MRYVTLALVLLSLSACHKNSDKSDPSPIPSNAYIGGIWTGNFQSTVDPVKPMLLNLAQNGTAITGVFNINNGQILGNVTGTVGGSAFDFAVAQTTPCTGTYTGSATVSDTAMSGAFTGTSGCLGTVSGTFSLSK